jgi:hypothetical protein
VSQVYGCGAMVSMKDCEIKQKESLGALVKWVGSNGEQKINNDLAMSGKD